jgi:hypothetical protein
MSDNAPGSPDITTLSMPEAAKAELYALQRQWSDLPQVDMPVHHVLHGGMYARTIEVPEGTLVIGVHVVVPTVVIIEGRGTLWAGGEQVSVDGYYVLAGEKNRKQMFHASARTRVTMVAASTARSVEEAEQQFTDEPESLISRRSDARVVIITGEQTCLESQSESPPPPPP